MISRKPNSKQNGNSTWMNLIEYCYIVLPKGIVLLCFMEYSS
jgi:hypothetical protein